VNFLDGSAVKVVAVANFPAGRPDPEPVKKEIMKIISDGGAEIDVVFPWRNWLDGDKIAGDDFITGCKTRCGNKVLLKVILETGEFSDSKEIYRASRMAIEAGADFLKTSTGKTPRSANPIAVGAMLDAIKDSASTDCGIKISGGIKTLDEALVYQQLAEQTMGAEWIDARHFRIGASALHAHLLDILDA
jgi:deoxyribose-phosphate aldolase